MNETFLQNEAKNAEAWEEKPHQNLPEIRDIRGMSYDEFMAAYPSTEIKPVGEVKKAEAINDPVNHPSYYCKGDIECIDAIKAAISGMQGIEAFCKGTAMKYIWRYPDKNGVQDLDKAVWYIKRLKKEAEEK